MQKTQCCRSTDTGCVLSDVQVSDLASRQKVRTRLSVAFVALESQRRIAKN